MPSTSVKLPISFSKGSIEAPAGISTDGKIIPEYEIPIDVYIECLVFSENKLQKIPKFASHLEEHVCRRDGGAGGCHRIGNQLVGASWWLNRLYCVYVELYGVSYFIAHKLTNYDIGEADADNLLAAVRLDHKRR